MFQKRNQCLKKLEENINKRHVKFPHFHFSFKTGETIFSAKCVDDISLSGQDAKVILASKDQLIEADEPCDLLEGVLFHNTPAPHINKISIRVVKELLTKLDGVEPNWGSKPSERVVGDLVFRAHRNVQSFCRNPAKNKSNSDELALYVELYHHASVLLFDPKKNFTPYKVKQFVLLELLRFGTIRSISNHMSEGTENSNHECKANYGSHTMRDGGQIQNTTSEFTDLFTSFLKCIDLGKESGKVLSFLKPVLENTGETGDEEQEEEEEDNNPTTNENGNNPTPTANKATNMYLSICQANLPNPRLLIGKETYATLLSGMKFVFIGTIALGKLKGEVVNGPRLKIWVTKMGGEIIENNVETLSDKVSKLPFHYCVLQDDSLFKAYQSGDMKGEISNKFRMTTRGDWRYLEAKFILDCHAQRKLLNPDDYLFKFDSNMFVKSRAFGITRHMERQRARAGTRQVLAKTALQRYHKTVRNATFQLQLPTTNGNAESKPKRGAKLTSRNNNYSVSVKAFNLYKRDYFKNHSKSHRNPKGSVKLSTINSTLTGLWKSNPSLRATFREKANTLPSVDTPVSSFPN